MVRCGEGGKGCRGVGIRFLKNWASAFPATDSPPFYGRFKTASYGLLTVVALDARKDRVQDK
jgi:hypothetical protein